MDKLIEKKINRAIEISSSIKVLDTELKALKDEFLKAFSPGDKIKTDRGCMAITEATTLSLSVEKLYNLDLNIDVFLKCISVKTAEARKQLSLNDFDQLINGKTSSTRFNFTKSK